MTLPDAYNEEDDAYASTDEPQASKRSRGVALGLCILGGFFGLHRFYVDKPKSAIAMIVTIGGCGFWWLYDVVLLAAGEFRDSQDLPLRYWGVEETPWSGRELSSRAEQRFTQIEEQFDAFRQQFNDLAERVDFAERMLAQQRNRSLEPGARSQNPLLQGPDPRIPDPGS